MQTLFLSGYADDGPMPEDLTQGNAYLSKPFTPDAFARRVRSMLDRRSS
jgi:DNA-binding response OmpR family regulator